MTDTRCVLKALLNDRYEINKQIDVAKREYLEEFKGKPVVWISDHAIVRYIERVLGHEIPESELGEKDAVVKYLYRNNLCGEEFRNSILDLKDQNFIIKSGIAMFRKDGMKYIFRDFVLVTILHDKKS